MDKVFAQADAHVGTGLDDIFLARKGILWGEISGVKVADIELLLSYVSLRDSVYDIRAQLRMLYVSWTCPEVATMQHSLYLWILAFAHDLFEKVKRAARTMIGGYHGDIDSLSLWYFGLLIKLKVNHPLRIYSELPPD